MAKKTPPSKKTKSKSGAKKKTQLKDLSPKPASTRMVVGGLRRYISG
jgi:hypothetical protein